MLENYSIVVIPTYNELDNISDIIDEIFSLNNNFHVLVVDDNSPDKTYRIVEEKIVEHKERLFLIKRDQKSGSSDGRRYDSKTDRKTSGGRGQTLSHKHKKPVTIHGSLFRN